MADINETRETLIAELDKSKIPAAVYRAKVLWEIISEYEGDVWMMARSIRNLRTELSDRNLREHRQRDR